MLLVLVVENTDLPFFQAFEEQLRDVALLACERKCVIVVALEFDTEVADLFCELRPNDMPHEIQEFGIFGR